MEWVKSVFQNRSESNSYDPTNGLILSDVLLPEEIVLLILSYVDSKSLLNCKLVCINWSEIIQSNSFWRLKLQPLKKNIKENIPWYIYYCLVYRNIFDTNLLKNASGENKLNYWHIHHNGGNKWKVENTPMGADPLPENVPDFNGKQCCFATSFSACSKSQQINLNENKLLSYIIREFHPTIIISEWYNINWYNLGKNINFNDYFRFAGRFDCGCTYKLNPKFLDKNRKIIYEKEEKRRVEQWEGTKWSKVIYIYSFYIF